MATETVVTIDVVVGSRVGLHARPAAMVAQAAAAQPVVVWVAKGGAPVQARSVLSLISLGAEHGDTVTVSAEGGEAQSAVDAVAAVIARDLDAE